MPIERELEFNCIDQDTFHRLDRVVTGLSFDLQNELGNLFREEIYKRELKARLQALGFEVELEVGFKVSHGRFARTFSCDMVIDRCVIYELKTVEALAHTHHQQLLSYLFLAGIQHGKLLNFKPSKVEYRYVSTSLDNAARREFGSESIAWVEPELPTSILPLMKGLIADWGWGLSLSLYQDALQYFLGNEHLSLRAVQVRQGEHRIGTQDMPVLANGSLLYLSALGDRLGFCEANLHKLLAATDLKSVSWINLGHRILQAKTLFRP